MKFSRLFFLPVIIFAAVTLVSAQVPPPPPTAAPLSAETAAKNLESAKQTGVSSERRLLAYQKLLEAQKYIWAMARLRSQTGANANIRQAREALQKAVELDPTLAEGYTALAEIADSIDDSLLYAEIGVKIAPDNYGAHRIAARIYTIKSRLSTGKLVDSFTQKAIGEWKEITRLDPRNAEGWAFLSEFYEKTGKTDEQINTLRKWRASATPSETQFFKRITGGQTELAPESASLKLAEVLLKKGETREALENINLIIADSPENTAAVELLRQAVESSDASSAATAQQSLQQAVFANPTNISLITLLAEIQARNGKTDDAAKTLRDASARLLDADKNASANLQVALGDLFAGKNEVDEAVKAYDQALSLRGVADNQPVTDDDRDFAIAVFSKIIQIYKKSNRFNDAKTEIEKARVILGKNDLFADSQTISFYRETGKKDEALTAVRGLRTKYPDDYGILRLEAQVLTENGNVDQGVALLRGLLKKNRVLLNGGNQTNSQVPVNYDDFTNYLFISSLYTQANRGNEAVDSAKLALTAAVGEERKQIAQLTLASAQQSSGDFASAEETLRDVLKKMPNNPTALNNLGYFLLERDVKVIEAFNLIEQAVKIEPANSSFLDSFGWAYFKLGKYVEAETYLLKAVRIDDSSAAIQEHLGDVYQKLGKTDAAKSAFQNAIKLTTEPKEITRIKSKIK